MLRRALPLVAWVGLLLALVVAMLAAGRGNLSAPAWSAPSGWSEWASTRGAPAAALAVVRLVVLAIAAWLLVVTAVSFVLAATRRGREVDVSELLGLPIVRRVVHGALGLGLAGATLAGAAGLGGSGAGLGGSGARTVEVASVAGSSPPVLERLGPAAGAVVATTTMVPATRTTAEVTPVSTTSIPVTLTTAEVTTATTVGHLAATTTSTSAAKTTPDVTGAPSVPPAVAVPPAVTVRTWVVRPGEHLWSIARQLLDTGTGPSPADAEVAPYWRQLTEANRDRLADPANPDLLFPGDQLVVPPIPSRSHE
jgi:hypothetical protein